MNLENLHETIESARGLHEQSIEDLAAAVTLEDPTPDRKLVIYHRGCIDGWTAALAAYSHEDWHTADYLAMNYGDDVEALVDLVCGDAFVDLVSGEDSPWDYVLFVDFSVPRRALKVMSSWLMKLIVIDHHKTAQAALHGLHAPTAGRYIYFDMERSGAGMAWDHLHGYRPKLVDYVEDRDIWRWALKDSQEINTYIGHLFNLKESFEDWWHILVEAEADLENMATLGRIVMEYRDVQVERIAGRAEVVRWHTGQKAVVVNSSVFQSEIGNLLIRTYADRADFAGVYSVSPTGEYYWSLRSDDDHADVSAIAEALDGGGHRNAAGARTTGPPAERLFEQLED